MQILIDAHGHLRCVYSEEIRLPSLGRITIRRGSHVEPERVSDGSSQWIADLTPVAGPRLGPFEHRSQAVRAELNWLERHWLQKRRLEKHALFDQSSG